VTAFDVAARLPGHTPEEVAAYLSAGYWGTDSVADYVRRWRSLTPDALAFGSEDTVMSWEQYDAASDQLAGLLLECGFSRGSRVAVLLPDGPEVHAAWLGAEKAGLVAVGIGARAGDREIAHLVTKSGAQAIITGPGLRRRPAGDRPAGDIADALAERGLRPRHIWLGAIAGNRWSSIALDGAPVAPPCWLRGDDPPSPQKNPPDEQPPEVAHRRLGPSEIFMINSTSGTTGLPKCVAHTQNRWVYFHQLAVDAGELTSDDVFCSAIPSPFGFGLWTAHFTPTLLGAPAYQQRRFQAEELLELLAERQVTVLSAVSTQFIMLLNSPALAHADLSALRVLYTGGEAVPYRRAAEFEDRTGAKVLQFYGSNETGAASYTTVRDDRPHRLSTAGKVIPRMQVRVLDNATGARATRGRGQPACRGPATCEGYWNDPEGNAALYTEDGWMLMGDLTEIDEDGYLSVVGRTSDIIIRGGKNISAPAVEAEVATHPGVAMAAAVAMPDPVFGERVCLYAQLRPGHQITLDDIVAHLDGRGVSREWFPEHLVTVEHLPVSSGGKIAKAELRADIRRRLAAPS
jgi:acyl-CoA synthetase